MYCLFFTKYTYKGPSSRYRSYQYLPYLQQAGYKCTVSPLFNDAYLSHKYKYGRAALSHVLLAFASRLWALLTVPSRSLIVIEYELFPFFPAIFERWLVWRGCRLVVDYDDALFHQYDNHAKSWVHRLLGDKIAKVMQLADTVVAGNDYLAKYALNAGANRVEVIPTVIDLQRYPVNSPSSDSNVFTIGWIGSPSTSRYLLDIVPALADICRHNRAQVRLIGSGPIDLGDIPFEILSWQEDTEVTEISRFDVGIMPLPDEPWARGKCGFKLIQYMACGLPVVASPVGVNNQIVEAGLNGFLAADLEQWVQALNTLCSDYELRKQMGVRGRIKVEKTYSLQVTAAKLLQVLNTVMESN